MAGAWSGTITCTLNCPAGATSGTITATLSQNDATGVVAGTYTVSGLPNNGSGNITTRSIDVLSGLSWQATATDNNGNLNAFAGGPLNGTIGLGLDRTFNGELIEQKDHDPTVPTVATYSVTMSH
jgi:hypothetical protein